MALSRLSEIDLSQLSPTNRQIIETNLNELERRKREEMGRYFNPTSPTFGTAHNNQPQNPQLEFYMSPVRERWIFGANRSGKSEIMVKDADDFATGRHPVRTPHSKPPVKIRFTAPPTTKDGRPGVVIDKFKEFVRRADLLGGSWERAYSGGERKLFYNDGRKPNNRGSFVQFLSNEQHVNKFGGVALDASYGDEHSRISYYWENKARLSDRDGFFVNDMTPEMGQITWERRHVLRSKNPDIKHWIFTAYGNPYLSADALKSLEASITDENIRQVKLWGKFAPLSGLIYDDFDENKHFIKFVNEDWPPEDWPRVFVADCHWKKAHALLWAAVSPEKELWVYRTAKLKATPEELKNYIRNQSLGESIVAWIGDEALGGDTVDNFGNQSFLKLLATGENAIPISGTNLNAPKHFEAGIYLVRELLKVDTKSGRPSLFIKNPDCNELVDEFYEYQAMPESAADELTFREKVRKINDDLLDCVRYAATWMANYFEDSGETTHKVVLPGKRHEYTGYS